MCDYGVDLADDLGEMADDVRGAIDDAVERTALQVERAAKQNAPVDTGTLRSSLRSERLILHSSFEFKKPRIRRIPPYVFTTQPATPNV